MRKFVFLAVAAVLSAATPSLAQVLLPSVLPAAEAWVDIRTLAPAVTDPETRAQMNAEIARAITAADGDDVAARRAITAIVNRYQDIASPQGARVRPGPK